MTSPERAREIHEVVVVGGGFGGMTAVRALSGTKTDREIRITLVDRRNFHLFQPLSYQVATGALSPSEIAIPLRRIFRRSPNVRVLLADVTGIDLARRVVRITPEVELNEGPADLPYDSLVVATGSSYAYFGHDEWRERVLEVKSLESAMVARRRILEAFEAAELESDPDERSARLRFVIIGAGPTGVEMAGQVAELARDSLPEDFRSVRTADAEIVLVEMGDRVLSAFDPRLSAKAEKAIEQLGIRTLLRRRVVDIDERGVTVEPTTGGGPSGRLDARTVIWAAGVEASPLARALAAQAGAPTDRQGRIVVEPDLSVRGHPEVSVLGDMADVALPDGSGSARLPGLAPVAMQQGRHVAKTVKARLAGRPTPIFSYRDKGNLATIGRGKAVAELSHLRLSGPLAWMTWLLVHIAYLIGFQNRLIVLIRWSISFFTRGRGARLITSLSS